MENLVFVCEHYDRTFAELVSTRVIQHMGLHQEVLGFLMLQQGSAGDWRPGQLVPTRERQGYQDQSVACLFRVSG